MPDPDRIERVGRVGGDAVAACEGPRGPDRISRREDVPAENGPGNELPGRRRSQPNQAMDLTGARNDVPKRDDGACCGVPLITPDKKGE